MRTEEEETTINMMILFNYLYFALRIALGKLPQGSFNDSTPVEGGDRR
jgi:hypothetical protein